jgi:cytochrome c oxidase subunit 2
MTPLLAAALAAIQSPQSAPPYDPLGMFPPNASHNAGTSDWVFYFVFWTCLVVLILVCVATLWFAWKYRRSKVGLIPQDSPHHSTTLEIVWSVIPSFFLVAMFWYGFKDYEDRRAIPADAYEIQVSAMKWSWTFTYPNGYFDSHLTVPANRNVRLRMNSSDVLHSLFIPAFRVKLDVVPGRYNWLWFNAIEPGVYPLYCTEYCGQQHSQMDARVTVLPPEEYDAWLAKVSNIADLPPEERGLKVFRGAGCSACHNFDGLASTGPALNGIFGTQRTMADGSTVTVDENYLRESILNPNAKISAGFAPDLMPPSFAKSLNDQKVDWLIELIKLKGAQ